jgi:hypothetical protein
MNQPPARLVFVLGVPGDALEGATTCPIPGKRQTERPAQRNRRAMSL